MDVASGASRSRRLLFVEDEPILAKIITRHLRTAGWDVDTVHDGAAGSEAARSGTHSTVLVDLRMPQGGGIAVLKAAQQAAVPPSVVVMSGFLDVANTMHALSLGAVDILEKPVEPQRLAAVLDQADLLWHRRSVVEPTRTENSAETVCGLYGKSAAMERLCERLSAVAEYPDLPVIIMGETGTGKELVAQAVHQMSGRRGPIVSINCASIPNELCESELFGHEAGAFTGAKSQRHGLFEVAGHGTIFLDEIGEMPLEQQAKLLRVLETRTYRRVGSHQDRQVNCRIISATNRALRSSDSSESMRPDLFFRLSGFTIRTPPLRERLEDIATLSEHFLKQFAIQNPGVPQSVSPKAVAALASYSWPGNVRELKSVVIHAAVNGGGDAQNVSIRTVVEAMLEHGCIMHDEPLTAPPPASSSEAPSEDSPTTRLSDDIDAGAGLPQIASELIRKAYDESNGNISRAARRLAIPRTTLRDRLRRMGIL